MRRGLLGQFAADVPITALVSGAPFYHGLAAERPSLTLVLLEQLAGGERIAPAGNVIVDGLDALDDPAAALRALREAAPNVRLFVLIGNAAYAPTLAAFVAGGRMAAARPLVAADIDVLFAASGWHEAERVPLVDRTLAHAALPYTIAIGGVTFTVTSPEMAARLSTAGYLIIADPR